MEPCTPPLSLTSAARRSLLSLLILLPASLWLFPEASSPACGRALAGEGVGFFCLGRKVRPRGFEELAALARPTPVCVRERGVQTKRCGRDGVMETVSTAGVLGKEEPGIYNLPKACSVARVHSPCQPNEGSLFPSLSPL